VAYQDRKRPSGGKAYPSTSGPSGTDSSCRIASSSATTGWKAHFLPPTDNQLDSGTTTERRRTPLTLYKRANIWWSYVTIDGVRHGKSTQTRNRRLAQQVDDKFKEELTVRRSLAPQFNPELLLRSWPHSFSPVPARNTGMWSASRLFCHFLPSIQSGNSLRTTLASIANGGTVNAP
jgi:hypothetical protein